LGDAALRELFPDLMAKTTVHSGLRRGHRALAVAPRLPGPRAGTRQLSRST
jgi:hypothetical protein